jgi:ribonuclease E
VRRRRRGRRGGRRNRRDRDGNGDYAAAHGQESHARPDYSDQPESSPPPFQADPGSHIEQPSSPTFEAPPQPAPAPQFEAAPPAPVPASEPPRRRSTVREAAPVFGSSEPVVIPPPPPAPIVISTAEADAPKPKRSGWWAKKLLGGD